MEEDALRERMLAKFAEDDRIEQMNAQKRRFSDGRRRRTAQRALAIYKNQRSIWLWQFAESFRCRSHVASGVPKEFCLA